MQLSRCCFCCKCFYMLAAWLKSTFTSIRGSMAVSRPQLENAYGKPGKNPAVCSRQKVCSLSNGLMFLLRQPQPHGQLRLDARLKNHSKRERNATEAPSCNPVVACSDWKCVHLRSILNQHQLWISLWKHSINIGMDPSLVAVMFACLSKWASKDEGSQRLGGEIKSAGIEVCGH